MPVTPSARELEHPCRLVDGVDGRREPEPLRRADRASGVARRSSKPTAQQPRAAATPDRHERDVLHGPQPGSQRPHPGDRAGLEADDHRVLVEQRERPLDHPVPPVAVGRLQLDHHPDPAPTEIEHLGERRKGLAASRPVVRDDELTVRPGMHVELDEVGADLDRALERRQRVLRQLRRGAAMGDHERARHPASRRRRTTSTSIVSISSLACGEAARRKRPADGDAAHPGPGRRGDRRTRCPRRRPSRRRRLRAARAP